MPYIADCSLSLINRTGAHFVAQEIVDSLPRHFQGVRYWRLLSRRLPDDPLRKILGRLMLRELSLLRDRSILQWPTPRRMRELQVLFMDPLYVLRARLTARDLVLCHDVGPVTHSELFDPQTHRMYTEAYAKIKASSPAMVFVSAASRDAFAALYGTAYPAMDVIPLFARRESVDGADEAVPGIRKPFLLTVGAFERRKNHPRSLAAFERSGLAQQGVGYVLCGARGLDWEQVHRAAAHQPQVHVLPYVTEAQLRWLYRNASAFVLPSLLEGFGMPALEAAQFGLLPVVSRGGALEEATGGLGIGVDPYSVESIAEGMRTALAMADDPVPRERLEAHARGSSRSRFLDSWDSLLRDRAAVPVPA